MPVSLEIIYAASEDLDCLLSTVIIHEFVMRDNHSPHKFTFLHPSGIVSYAILRSPSRKVTSEISPRGRLPIILNLHGAGLEADSRQVRHTLDSAPDVPAWVLFPTGVTSWSSDDWRKCLGVGTISLY